jgi:aldehyde dehydrogenase (NAD+)
MKHSAIETETAELTSPPVRLEQLRKTVDEGVHRSLSWRHAQLDGLLQFVSDQEEAMLAALNADLGRCAAEARLADVLMVRSELKLIRRNLRRWLHPSMTTR